MTDHERPWWMLHWPSWMALVVIGGAFVVLNLLASRLPDKKAVSERDTALNEYACGWPMSWRYLTDSRGIDTPVTWAWSMPVVAEPKVAFAKKHLGVFSNFLIGTVVLWLSISHIEGMLRRRASIWPLKVTNRALLFLTAIVGAGVGLFPSRTVPLTVAAFCFVIFAIGFASLTVLDFIGWLLSRFLKRGG